MQRRIQSATTLLAVLAASLGVFAQDASLTLDEKEEFLPRAKIVSQKQLSQGITCAARATLTDGKLTHDVQIQDYSRH